MYEPQTIGHAITPLILANSFLGVGLIEYRTTLLRRIFNFCYSLLIVIGFCVLLRFSTVDLRSVYDWRYSVFKRFTFASIFYGNAMLTLCLIVAGWFRIKKMRAIVTGIDACDQIMEKMGLPRNYQNLFRHQLYWLAGVSAIFVIFVVVNCKTMINDDILFSTKVIVGIVVHYPIALMIVVDVSFYFWVRYTRFKLSQVNGLLRSLLTTTPQSPQHKRVLAMKYDQITKGFSSLRSDRTCTNDNTQTIKEAKQIHLELIKSARNTNEAYGIQILLKMTLSFVLITVLLFDAYKIIWFDLPEGTKVEHLVPVCFWIAFYVFKIFIVNHACAKTSTEAANAGDIICELYEPSTSREFRAEIRDFTLQLIQNPLTFTACGFFDLDHTFIQGVIGSITTYLVILIQVGDMSTPEETSNSNDTSIDSNLTSSTTTPFS